MDRTGHVRDAPCLRVALVGEVNSGKTTLVNALLGEPFLPVSAVASTRCAIRVRYGGQRGAEFRPGEAALVTYPAEQFWTALRDLCPDARPRSLREAVELLVTCPHAGDRVDALHVDNPSPFLAQGVEVIDTPGINADDDRQAAIPLAVVADETDIVTVVVSAIAPVSRTLVDFLPATASHRGRRCVVVSKVDQVEAQERSLVLRSVRRRLDLADLDDAPVFSAAAVAASGGRQLIALATSPDGAPRRVEEAVARRAVRWAVDLDRRLGHCTSARQVGGVVAELQQLDALARTWTAGELDRFDADLRTRPATAVASVLDRLANHTGPPTPFHVRLALAAAPWAAVTDARTALQHDDP